MVMKPLAILGGTFDPVHIGHLNAAWEATELLDAEVRLVPARIPPHRPLPLASAAQRSAMLRVALQGQSRLSLDTRELRREGLSYTADTLAELRAEQGDRPLVLLLGEDAFADLPLWHRWRTLFDLAHLGVLTRPDTSPQWSAALGKMVGERLSAHPRDVHHLAAGRVVMLPVTPLEISATRVRELITAERIPRYLLPAALWNDPDLLAPYRGSRKKGFSG